MAASVLALLTGGAVWQLAFRAPAVDPVPLPEGLVSLTAVDGRRLLTDSQAIADFEPLMRFFEAQRRPAFCGVASSVAVLNALHPSCMATFEARTGPAAPTGSHDPRLNGCRRTVLR